MNRTRKGKVEVLNDCCTLCNGKGTFKVFKNSTFGKIEMWVKCAGCSGTGKLIRVGYDARIEEVVKRVVISYKRKLQILESGIPYVVNFICRALAVEELLAVWNKLSWEEKSGYFVQKLILSVRQAINTKRSLSPLPQDIVLEFAERLVYRVLKHIHVRKFKDDFKFLLIGGDPKDGDFAFSMALEDEN